jgi:hypothetical protein
LLPNSRYFLFVEAPGHGSLMLDNIKPGQPRLNVALGPELYVRGKVIHIDPSATREGVIHLGYYQNFQFDNNGFATGWDLVLTPKNGEADFVTGPLYPLPVDIGVDIGAHDHWIKIDSKDLPKSGAIIDLAADPAGANNQKQADARKVN